MKIFKSEWSVHLLGVWTGWHFSIRQRVLASVVAVSTLTSLAEARPELFLAEKTRGIVGFSRHTIIVVTNEGTPEKPVLRMRRPGIVPLDKSSHFKWFQDGDSKWREAAVGPFDQFNMSPEMYGNRVTTALRFKGCLPLGGVKVVRANPPGEAWLASCETSVLNKLPHAGEQVVVDLKRGVLESMDYRYTFKPKNNMLFDAIELKRSDASVVKLAHDGDLLIYADVKNFFSLQFDSGDIESLMRATRVEDFGALATIQFYLRILFFKITLDLDTDVAFYRSNAHIPMVLTVPKDAEKSLNPNSGILYSFVLDEGVTYDRHSKMPLFESNANQTVGGSVGYCEGDQCSYTVRFKKVVQGIGSEFSMELLLPKVLVDRGMFPRYVEDVIAHKKDMGWKFSKRQQSERRSGLYFEVSRLPAGEHAWDLWLGLKP